MAVGVYLYASRASELAETIGEGRIDGAEYVDLVFAGENHRYVVFGKRLILQQRLAARSAGRYGFLCGIAVSAAGSDGNHFESGVGIIGVGIVGSGAFSAEP